MCPLLLLFSTLRLSVSYKDPPKLTLAPCVGMAWVVQASIQAHTAMASRQQVRAASGKPLYDGPT